MCWDIKGGGGGEVVTERQKLLHDKFNIVVTQHGRNFLCMYSLQRVAAKCVLCSLVSRR